MLCDNILMICLLGVVPLLVILIFVVIYRKKGDTKTVLLVNKQKEGCEENLDKELRESFLKEYVNHDSCVWVKLKSLPKSFKIGNVYFDKCVYNSEYYQSFLSYVVVDRKVYDNGYMNIRRDVNLLRASDEFNGYYESTSFCLDVSNKDLMNYILNNLDKAEEVKQ